MIFNGVMSRSRSDGTLSVTGGGDKMAAGHRAELGWTSSSTLSASSSLTSSTPPTGVTSAPEHGVWAPTLQPDMLRIPTTDILRIPTTTPRTIDVWDQLLDHRTGNGNTSNVTSRVEIAGDVANRRKPGNTDSGAGSLRDAVAVVARPSPPSYGLERPRPPPPAAEVASEITGSHVYSSEVEYHLLCRRDDRDDHVITTDRKSLDSRKLTPFFVWLYGRPLVENIEGAGQL